MRTHTHRLSRAIVALLALLLSVPATAHQFIAKDLEIKHPYTVEPSGPAVQYAAVYMVIRNTGPNTEKLIAARSPFATSVSIEGTNGTAGSIDIPGHAETVIGPKTTYLQLHGLTEPLDGYQYMPMTLIFAVAGIVEIEIYVEAASDTQVALPKTK